MTDLAVLFFRSVVLNLVEHADRELLENTMAWPSSSGVMVLLNCGGTHEWYF